MTFIDFPETYRVSIIGKIIAYPAGFWSLDLRASQMGRAGEFKGGCKSLLIWPDGNTKLLPGYLTNSTGYDQIDYVGRKMSADENEILKQRGLSLTAHQNSRVISVLSFDGEKVKESECRIKSSELNPNQEPKEPNVIASVIPKDFPKIKTDAFRSSPWGENLENVIQGIIGINLGIGFYRKNGSGVFIQPDESKDWKMTCTSVDELTCLAVHENGGCIIDTPV